MCPPGFAERVRRSEHDTASRRSTPEPTRETTLVVGAGDDRAEREADRVSAEVIARLDASDLDTGQAVAHHGHSHVARSSGSAGPAPEVGFEGGALSAGLSDRIEGRRGSGAQLPVSVRSRLEPAFGGSLADVRVHADAESEHLNRAVSARAFTTGSDIFFGAGEYRPDAPDGERVLAHEIAHTRQHGSGARRTTIRRWDIKAANLGLHSAQKVKTLKKQPIWFLEDADGDQVVVKTEDQPTGMGLLAASLHKQITGVSSVKQRKLTNPERGEVDLAFQVQSVGGTLDHTWRDRGDQLKSEDAAIPATDDSRDVALEDARKRIADQTKSAIAMTVAEGKGADQLAEPRAGKGDLDDDRSRFRELLMNKDHLIQLGKMAAVDLFFGNQDRITNRNLGNWFVNPQSVIMLIDHLDPGSGPRAGTVALLNSGQWVNDIAFNFFMGPGQRKSLAVDLAKGAWIQGGDDKAQAWLAGPMTGGNGATRRQFMDKHLEAGFQEGRKHIDKVFSSTRWSVGKSKAHAAKQKIRGKAAVAAAEDNNAAGYYAELKQRAQWIKKNAK